jgi:UDP-2,3-diacylglucosamine hydrolase
MSFEKIHLIADLHLDNNAQKTQLFVDFCEKKALHAQQLFILGDLFNVWLGDDISLKHHSIVINALKKLSKKTQIFILRGNRDFLLGKDFEQATGASIINSQYQLRFQSQNYLLTHGDEFCTDDKDYQRFKSIIQNPIMRFILLHTPEKFRQKLGNHLRKKSQKAQQRKTMTIMDVNINTVDKCMKRHPNTHLIHGHTHRKKKHTYLTYSRFVLGDWSNKMGSYIEITDKLCLLEFHQSGD